MGIQLKVDLLNTSAIGITDWNWSQMQVFDQTSSIDHSVLLLLDNQCLDGDGQ